MVKAQRPNGGYVFHGGCDGCPNDLSICPTCCYMEANWRLPSKNPVEIERDKKRAEMRRLAKQRRKGLLNPTALTVIKGGD